MSNFLNLFVRKIRSLLGTREIPFINDSLGRIKELNENYLIDNYLKNFLFDNSKYLNNKRLGKFHKSVFTQNGEDGIIEEIFNRIGLQSRYFVEFGVHGLKNNSTFLLIKGWTGLWIGGSKIAEKVISKDFSELIKSGNLKFSNSWITAQNIENIFEANDVPKEIDYLSIDLDGNDYWIWQALNKYSPRLVSIEYNASFPPEISWIMKYNPNHVWKQNSYFGASLLALQKLGNQKGYELIACDFTGCNAFFLRNDQNLDLFEAPFTAENHYEPPRYFLRKSVGHPKGFGPFQIN